MKVLFLLGCLMALILPSEANAKDCHIPPFSFRFTSEGPWPAHMTVEAGKSCGSRYWNFRGVAKALYLAAAPRHGKVTLSFPGTYRYFPSAGYVGDDGFTLRICGTVNGGYEGCANLLFTVNVVNGGV